MGLKGGVQRMEGRDKPLYLKKQKMVVPLREKEGTPKHGNKKKKKKKKKKAPCTKRQGVFSFVTRGTPNN